MSRREEIENAAKQKYPYEGGTKGIICESSIPIFIQGAEWADKTIIDKAILWLTTQGIMYVICESDLQDLIYDFTKAMKD